MIFDEAGTYQIEYTATDDCGNETVAERTVIVEEPPTYRTVLYTDGTFIINESSRDEEANIAAHGQPTNVYAPFDPNGATDADKYIFTISTVLWKSQRSSIISVEFGSNVSPTDMKFWFYNLTNMTSFDATNLDTSLVTSMQRTFDQCYKIETLDLSGFDTSNVINMAQMFSNCDELKSVNLNSFDTSNVTDMSSMFRFDREIETLDLSSFNTVNVTNMGYMFGACVLLKTIYASTDFVVSQVTSSSDMLFNLPQIVGGAGTTYNSSNPTDKTYAHIDGGTSNPGYFTAKS